MKKISTSLVASFFLATNLFSTDTLETITVTSATKTEQSIKDVTSNIDVITAEEIEEKHYTTVVDALNTIPGISFTSNGGIGQPTSVYLRGMDSNKTLVLIDGIRYNDPTGLSGANFAHLMITDIERIEVIKGAQSSIWGADASAGVINIITKKAKEGTFTNISTEYGSYNFKKVNAGVSHKNKKFDVKLNVLRVDTDGFTSISPKGSDIDDFEDDEYKNTSIDLKAGYNFNENNRLSVGHNIIKSKTNYDSILSDASWNTDPIASANSKAKVKSNNSYSNINYENVNSFATTNVYANRSTFERRDDNPSISDFDGSVDEYGIKTTIPYLDNSSFITVGADYKEYEHENNLKKTYDSKAIYLTNNNKFFNDNTIFTQSLRFDDYDKFDDKTTGKVGIKQYIVDELNISSNYGTGYNVPTIYQLFEPAQDWGWGPSPVGNADLQPEKTKGYDIGIEYKGFSITYFHTKVNNMISWGNGYENIDGDSKLKGTEIAYKNGITEDIFLNLGYTNLSAKDADDERLINRPKNKFTFGADYYGIEKFHFNVNGEYIGSRKSVGFVDYNENVKTGNYTLWNTVINYEINKNFSAFIKVNNIFDKQYQVLDGYATEERSGYLGVKATF
ncbi:TonB-dependent receptor plug domain-containing protein [Aliarcobacter butzleri]|uniref:TonB-dependent receptor plug domain-containing protein n=1 Tax=Aliarcobacter butzleri TaxID=28197 RepID=UPI001EDB197F|nr:TonB-dependent receptor [Aliarcobacter butzleri]MCG3671430.1 TonB-dependent receptor [Aliarcobacter butzleri]MCG3689688.1 TonB-dependent receptor [Aliarcobacter butzleri]